MIRCSYNLFRSDSSKFLHGPVPVYDTMVFTDNKGGYGGPLDNTVQSLFALDSFVDFLQQLFIGLFEFL